MLIAKYLHGAKVNFGSLLLRDKIFVLRDGDYYRIHAGDKKTPLAPFKKLMQDCRQAVIGVEDAYKEDGLTIDEKESKNIVNIHNCLRKIRHSVSIFVSEDFSKITTDVETFKKDYFDKYDEIKKPMEYLRLNFADLVRVTGGKPEFRQLPDVVKRMIQPNDVSLLPLTTAPAVTNADSSSAPQ